MAKNAWLGAAFTDLASLFEPFPAFLDDRRNNGFPALANGQSFFAARF
jgi:hypothetical protein